MTQSQKVTEIPTPIANVVSGKSYSVQNGSRIADIYFANAANAAAAAKVSPFRLPTSADLKYISVIAGENCYVWVDKGNVEAELTYEESL